MQIKWLIQTEQETRESNALDVYALLSRRNGGYLDSEVSIKAEKIMNQENVSSAGEEYIEILVNDF